MDPGFYGLHVHGIGECEPDSAAPDDPEDTGAFKSAGGHLGSQEADHPDHAGDLPTLLVQESGDAHLTFRTDRISLDDFEDEDGAAMMVHSAPDNFANIPERYAPDGPDEDTTGAGDAGDRLACGVIEPAA
ncbi:superoxide dismutase family protein [Citricoccus parietis]